jgi:integrase
VKPTGSGPAIVKMIDMRWQDVTDAGLLVDQRKGRGRVKLLIEWTPALKAAIDACTEGIDKIGHLLKTSTRSQYAYWGIRSAWVSARERAEVKDLNIHDLRGNAGAMKAERDGKEEAQKMLGHANMRTTEHYIESKLRKVVKPAK